jgi:hypothetical protein
MEAIRTNERISLKDRAILRDLAQQYSAICQRCAETERRALWRRHNSLQRTLPLIYVRAFAWAEMAESRLQCADPFFHPYEDFLRMSIFRDRFGDDFIFEPWVTVDAAWITPPQGIWGPEVEWVSSGQPGGARRWIAPIAAEDDLRKLVPPQHAIDEAETERRASRLHDAIGDLLTISVDRGPAYRMWNADISTQLAYLRGLEQVMWDMVDRPAWLHGLLAFMRDGILRTHEQAEAAGDWRLCDHQNQAMAYAEELADPAANGTPVTRKQLWAFCASQELTGVGPRMFDEFMLQYQIPFLKPFGLVAYGCCEDLTRKIDVLRQIPNLRRIAVAPRADAARCAEQIGTDYVFSYRPSPADMVGYGFNLERIREILRRDLTASRHCHVDVTLKDVETVQGDRDRVRNWVEITRQVIEEVF